MATASPTPAGEATLEGGSYEVIRARLLAQAEALNTQASGLNERRKQLFGGTELTVIGNERVRTENNCVARDIVGVGRYMLFGYNVFIGLKKETRVSDVFSLHKFEKTAEGYDLAQVPSSEAGGFLADPRFVKDFGELYKYYKDAKLLQLRRTESRLLAIFQTGLSERDIKVFRFSLDVEGNATYMDNQGERDHVFPPSHDFEWTVATRENYVLGPHPHVNVLDQVFVETVKGDLTVKVENNTADGLGIYREPVEDADQSLDDAEYRVREGGRAHPPARAAVPRAEAPLPRLQHAHPARGAHRRHRPGLHPSARGPGHRLPRRLLPADGGLQGLREHWRGPALQARHPLAQRRGRALRLLPQRPGRLRALSVQPGPQGGAEPAGGPRLQPLRGRAHGGLPRHHRGAHPRAPDADVADALRLRRARRQRCRRPPGYLGKVGNAELVRGISDALTLVRMARSDKPSRRTYEDLAAAGTRMLDAFYWLGHEETRLQEGIESLRRTSELIIDEFEKVLALRKRATDSLATAADGPGGHAAARAPRGAAERRGLHECPVRAAQAARPAHHPQGDPLHRRRQARGAREASGRGDRPRQRRRRGLPAAGRGARAPGPAPGRPAREARAAIQTTVELVAAGRGRRGGGQGPGGAQRDGGRAAGGRPAGAGAHPRGRSPSCSPGSTACARGCSVKRKELVGREERAEFGAQFKLLGPGGGERPVGGGLARAVRRGALAPHRAARGARGPLRRVRRVPRPAHPEARGGARRDRREAAGAARRAPAPRAEPLHRRRPHPRRRAAAAPRPSRRRTSSTRTSRRTRWCSSCGSSPSSSWRCGDSGARGRGRSAA